MFMPVSSRRLLLSIYLPVYHLQQPRLGNYMHSTRHPNRKQYQLLVDRLTIHDMTVTLLDVVFCISWGLGVQVSAADNIAYWRIRIVYFQESIQLVETEPRRCQG
jgi:hypothetical protein